MQELIEILNECLEEMGIPDGEVTFEWVSIDGEENRIALDVEEDKDEDDSDFFCFD